MSRLAIISGSVAFFAPDIGMVPLSGRPPTMRMRSMSRPLLRPKRFVRLHSPSDCGESRTSAKAPHVWAHPRAARLLANRGVELTDPLGAGDSLPGGIRAFETARRGEVVYWLPRQRALAVGDVLLGAGAKPRATSDPLRLCPERWLGKATHDDLRESLASLLELPVVRVLVSHGEPVLRGGARALAAVLSG